MTFGLLYQKDGDTGLDGKSAQLFPITEITRALKCFGRRREFAGQEACTVHIHPAHAPLIEAQKAALGELNLTYELNPKVALRYIWLIGRPKANEPDVGQLDDGSDLEEGENREEAEG